MNIQRTLLIAQGVIIVTLAVVQVTASNLLSTDGIDLAQIKTQINVVKKENIVLEEKIYTQSSLTQVASKAATIGFIPDNQTVYIPLVQPIAIRP